MGKLGEINLPFYRLAFHASFQRLAFVFMPLPSPPIDNKKPRGWHGAGGGA
jgi:hypothetical protein